MSHGLPYEWRPLGAKSWFDAKGWDGRRLASDEIVKPGMLIPWAHKVYVCWEIREVPRDMWRDDEVETVALMQAARDRWVANDGASIRRPTEPLIRHPQLLIFIPYPAPLDPVKAMPTNEKRTHLTWRGFFGHRFMDYYPSEHFPQCSKCGEPAPCREEMAAKVAAQMSAEMERYADPNKCPECRSVVTPRQGRETFGWNLHVPAGPPVTFHTRKECVIGLQVYRRALKDAGYFTLAALDPDGALPL